MPRSATPGLVFTRTLVELGQDPRPLQRAARGPSAPSGVRRVRRGAYIDSRTWEAARRDERYLYLVQATVAGMRSMPILAHESAAVVHGLPLVGAVPPQVHVLAPGATGGRSSGRIRRHVVKQVPEVVAVDGFMVTTVADTVIALARTRPLVSALAAADHALASGLTTPSELQAAADAARGHHGYHRALVAVRHADARAESVGESVSRAQMITLGLPLPQLQREFHDEAGFIGRVDFWWEKEDVIGEFDGKEKYLGGTEGGRSPGEVVWREKRREDRLRRQVHGLLRWAWQDVLDGEVFARMMAGAGIVPTPRRRA